MGEESLQIHAPRTEIPGVLSNGSFLVHVSHLSTRQWLRDIIIRNKVNIV